MKTKLHFTRGEWAAALFLLTVMTAGNLYYFLCDIHPKPSCDVHQYETQFQQFAEHQARMADSVEATRQRTYGEQPRSQPDTLPPFKSQPRKPMYDIVKLDLNSCDTDALVTVPQFGSKRAAKLVEYREKLGGFHSLSQLQEVYVLQNIDTVKLKDYFYIDKRELRKLNINTATYAGYAAVASAGYPTYMAVVGSLIASVAVILLPAASASISSIAFATVSREIPFAESMYPILTFPHPEREDFSLAKADAYLRSSTYFSATRASTTSMAASCRPSRAFRALV